MQRLLLIAGMIALVACSPKSDTAPDIQDVPGSWSGPIADARQGGGTLSLLLTQSGTDSLVGTWATAFPDTSIDMAGSVTGTVSGSTVLLTLKPNNPPTCQYGPFDVTASVTGASMSGTFMTFFCTVIDSGTFSATRQ